MKGIKWDIFMKFNTISLSFLLFALITFLFVFECKGEEPKYNIENHNSFFKTGIVLTVGGIVLGAAAGVMFATNKKPDPPWMKDRNYENRQQIAGGMIAIAIPITSVGVIMTIIGIKHNHR
jgi:hypothetical protein